MSGYKPYEQDSFATEIRKGKNNNNNNNEEEEEGNVEQSQLIELTKEQKKEYITRNLQEVLNMGIIDEILDKRDLKIYWGTATTGKPHIAYFVPMTKIADFLTAHCEVTVLLADLHAYLDNLKSDWATLEYRIQYYKEAISGILECIGVPLEKLKFVKGTTYQLTKEFNLDVYKLTTLTSERYAKKAGAEVVKQVEHPLISGMLYPLLQALDEEYLGVDAQFGGSDQRKIFTYAVEFLPKLGYKKRAHLMNHMVQGLNGGKMSASDVKSKIELTDSPKEIKKKIKQAYCKPKELEGNGLITFAKFVVFPVLNCRQHFGKIDNAQFSIKRPEKYGGDIIFDNYESLEESFVKGDLYPQDLKTGISDFIVDLLAPLRRRFSTKENIELSKLAYPQENNNNNKNNKKNNNKNNNKKNNNNNKKNNNNQADRPIDCSRLDLRVGEILSVEDHPKAPGHLYIEKINVGEDEPRNVVSGIAKFFKAEDLIGKKVVVCCNVRPSNFKGVKSQALLLAGSEIDPNDESKTVKNVVLVTPPNDSTVGDKISFPGFEMNPDKVLGTRSKNYFAQISQSLSTNDDGVAVYVKEDKSHSPFTTSKGVCTVPGLSNMSIS